MVDNNNYQTTNNILVEENIVKEPYHDNNFNNNNQIQIQTNNNTSEPFIYTQSENQTIPIENAQINNEQNNAKEVRDKREDKRRLISMFFCFGLIAITIGSEILQLKLRLFSIFLLIDDLIVFANSIIYLFLFFSNIKINNYWFLIPHGIVIFGGIGFKVVGIRVFPDSIIRIIIFILFIFKTVGLFPIPCWLAG